MALVHVITGADGGVSVAKFERAFRLAFQVEPGRNIFGQEQGKHFAGHLVNQGLGTKGRALPGVRQGQAELANILKVHGKNFFSRRVLCHSMVKIQSAAAMKLPCLALLIAFTGIAAAEDTLSALRRSLTFHASFDQGFEADFSRGETTCRVRQGKDFVPAAASPDLRLAPKAGRFGGALHFPRKGSLRPQFSGPGMLGYNDRSWSTTVSVWLRLTPDEDLEPGYCDPVQIVGNDGKKGFIFLEWSKDETPRFFRFAVRPLLHLWNPDNAAWDQIPAAKRPMVQLARAPFSRQRWTHVAFTLDQVNDKAAKPTASLFLDGEPQGTIRDWDLTLGWDPASVALVLGASYVGHLDDLAVFDRALGSDEVKALFELDSGVADLR